MITIDTSADIIRSDTDNWHLAPRTTNPPVTLQYVGAPRVVIPCGTSDVIAVLRDWTDDRRYVVGVHYRFGYVSLTVLDADGELIGEVFDTEEQRGDDITDWTPETIAKTLVEHIDY